MNLEILGGSKLKDKIITILTTNHPLTAKKIYNNLKKNHKLSITYQATHKALKELLKSEIIIVQEREYEINLMWIRKIQKFSEFVNKEYTSKINKNKIKVISFDLGGCISDNAFDELIWRTEIPKIYAKENKITFKKAFSLVTSEYQRLKGKIEGWKNVNFWFNHFRFKKKPEDLMKNMKNYIKHYDDIAPVLEDLSKHFKLIVISQADRTFLNLKIKVNKFEKYFYKTYSTISDFQEHNKNEYVFNKICEELNITKNEIIHIGDSEKYDFEIPSSLGIKAFIIDRLGTENSKHSIKNLLEFKDKLIN